MIFLSPAWLWALTALIPIAAVYFLKVRPRTKKTNAFFLWEKILAEKESSALFRRMRDLISMLLMLLVAAAIAFALGRPQLEQEDKRDLLVVIDTSASMKAGSPSRFSEAQAEARDIVRAMNGTRRVALAVLDRDLRFRTHLSDSPKDLLEAIDMIQVTDLPLEAEALNSLGGFVQGDANRVIFISDGTGDFSAIPEAVDVLTVQRAGGNVGITAADLRWIPGRPGGANAFVRVSSSFKEAKQVELEIRHVETGFIGKLASLTIPPGVGKGLVYEMDDVEPGYWQMALSVDDSLKTDNIVDLGLNPARPIPVQVEADDPFFFQRCIEAFSLGGGKLRPGGGEEALTVAVGSVPSARNVIVFAPSGESDFWKALGEEVVVGVAGSDNETHPVIEHIDLVGLSFAGAREMELVEGSSVLAESEAGVPLIVKVQKAEQTVIIVNLDPGQGDFFLSPWFPVLIYDAAVHLAGRDDELAAVFPTGNVIDLPGEGVQSVTTPSGTRLSVESLRLSEPGLYVADVRGKDWMFGAGVLAESESVMPVSSNLPLPEAMSSGYPLAVWLLFFALVVLCAEVLMYHRRKAG